MVDNHTEVTSTEKFNLLALKGQVLQLAQGLPIAPENSARVWNVFVKTYENKKLIAATYVRQLLGLKSRKCGRNNKSL